MDKQWGQSKPTPKTRVFSLAPLIDAFRCANCVEWGLSETRVQDYCNCSRQSADMRRRTLARMVQPQPWKLCLASTGTPYVGLNDAVVLRKSLALALPDLNLLPELTTEKQQNSGKSSQTKQPRNKLSQQTLLLSVDGWFLVYSNLFSW